MTLLLILEHAKKLAKVAHEEKISEQTLVSAVIYKIFKNNVDSI